jgi:hypothetical protein
MMGVLQVSFFGFSAYASGDIAIYAVVAIAIGTIISRSRRKP